MRQEIREMADFRKRLRGLLSEANHTDDQRQLIGQYKKLSEERNDSLVIKLLALQQDFPEAEAVPVAPLDKRYFQKGTLTDHALTEIDDLITQILEIYGR
jgi:hypothetical protein